MICGNTNSLEAELWSSVQFTQMRDGAYIENGHFSEIGDIFCPVIQLEIN